MSTSKKGHIRVWAFFCVEKYTENNLGINMAADLLFESKVVFIVRSLYKYDHEVSESFGSF